MYIQRDEQVQFICIIRVLSLSDCNHVIHTYRNFRLLNHCSYVNRVFKHLYWYFNIVYSKDCIFKCLKFLHKEQSSRWYRFLNLCSKRNQGSNYFCTLCYFPTVLSDIFTFFFFSILSLLIFTLRSYKQFQKEPSSRKHRTSSQEYMNSVAQQMKPKTSNYIALYPEL